jgi:eukaryotic-like serine/threonine-protein kinase
MAEAGVCPTPDILERHVRKALPAKQARYVVSHVVACPPCASRLDALESEGESAVLTVGRLINDKYRVERVIGRGGMGVVLEATQLELDRRVAIKCLFPKLQGDSDALMRFSREARAAAKLRSEHTIRVFDVGRLESRAPFIVMELLDGCDLHRYVAREGPLSIEDALAYVEQACIALEEAHALGLVHRDLKPHNLFLTRRPDGTPIVKVLDFGLVKAVRETRANEHTDTNIILGTPLFMAPEQFERAMKVDARTDIWALGASLYFLLTGSFPFYGKENSQVFAAIARSAMTPIRERRPEIPEEIDEVIRGCLRRNPAERFQTATELRRALAKAAPRAEKIAASAAAPLQTVITERLPAPAAADTIADGAFESPKSTFRSPRAITIGSVALVAFAAVLVAFVLQPTKSAPPPRAEIAEAPEPAASSIPPPADPPVQESAALPSRPAASPDPKRTPRPPPPHTATTRRPAPPQAASSEPNNDDVYKRF